MCPHVRERGGCDDVARHAMGSSMKFEDDIMIRPLIGQLTRPGPVAYTRAGFFTARRNAGITSAVLAIASPSVCLSVCLSHAGIVSKRLHVARCSLHCQIAKCACFCRNQKYSPGTTPSPWNLGSTWPTSFQKAVSFDTFCLVARQR